MDLDKVVESFITTIIPQIILITLTGIITNILTKHFNKQPNDKLEITYNRIYYPLYRIIVENQNKKADEIDYIKVRDELKKKIQYYNKYLDRTTMKAYEQFDQAINSKNKVRIKNTYKNIVSENIITYNNKLRKILGYLEPNFFQVYKYSSAKSRFRFRCIIFTISIIILIYFYSIFYETHEISERCLDFLMVIIIFWGFDIIVYYIKKIYNWILGLIYKFFKIRN